MARGYARPSRLRYTSARQAALDPTFFRTAGSEHTRVSPRPTRRSSPSAVLLRPSSVAELLRREERTGRAPLQKTAGMLWSFCHSVKKHPRNLRI